MLTENRSYNFIGALTLHRSAVLNKQRQPKDALKKYYILIQNRKFEHEIVVNKYGQGIVGMDSLLLIFENLEIQSK